jgi:pimeloyl-ACP methyl ester carboxylesterase
VQSWSPGFHWGDWPLVGDFLLQPDVAHAVCGYYRADLDASLDLEPVRAPATVIYGAQDGCIRPLAYVDIDRWFEGGVRHEMVPHVGHWPHLEDPGGVVPLISAALSSA